MTVRTTLSFTERHHKFILEQVEEGIYASQSAMVADAVETMIRREEERERALQTMADEIRRRMETPREEYLAWDDDDNPVTRALDAIRQNV